MTPASLVIKRFGGVRALARALKIDHSSVSRWPAPKEKRGSGGLIPSVYHARILDLAAEKGITLTATELIYGNGE